MALIRNTAAMRLRGRVGNTTYYTEGGRQIARVSQNSSNYGETARRTEQQQSQRAKWANLVNFYKASRSWMPKAFENKKRTQSDYNRFMQLNVAAASVYLTKDMYAQGGCVVEPYKITEGSLRSVNVYKQGNVWFTDLLIGSLEINDSTTIGVLSSFLINNNSHLHNGVQISFLSYQQTLTANETPQVICTAYEMTLDTNSEETARHYLPSFCLNSVQGAIGTDANISTGCFAYIISDSTSGKTLVSTQTLINNNDVLIGQYSSYDAIVASIASYGVDKDVFLMSGSAAQDAAAGTLYVAGVFNYSAGTLLPVGELAIVGDSLYNPTNNTIAFDMSSMVTAPPSSISGALVFVSSSGGSPTIVPMQGLSAVGKRVTMSFSPGSFLGGKLVSAEFTLGGRTYEGTWPNGPVEHE